MRCGEPAAESTIEIAAVSDPMIDGVNETEIEQLAPDGSVAGQVFDRAKSEALGPVAEILEMVRNDVPVSVRVMMWGVLLVVTV